MFEVINIDENVIMSDILKRVLKLRNSQIKFNVLVNYVLCNQFDHYYDKEKDLIVHFMLRKQFKNFLEKNKMYVGDIYSREGVILLLTELVIKKRIHITI